MDEPTTFRGIACVACGATPPDPALVADCPDCGGRLSARFRFDAPLAPADVPRADGRFRFDDLLPVPGERALTMAEGPTPLVDCPSLADDAGVDRLLIKDEGANPTGSVADRGAALSVAAAAEAGAGTVALPSTGHAGRSVAAYAGRAGLDAAVFLPARAPFDCKAMVNVHGGEMTVAGGRYPQAVAAFEDAVAPGWADLGPASVHRREGLVSLYGELLAARDWAVPTAIVVPAGHGATIVGLAAAIDRFEAAGLAGSRPSLLVAQPEGCAPIADAVREQGTVEPVDRPDTIVGALEIPEPVLGAAALDALRALGGRARSVDDDDALAAAVDANATAGLEVGVAGGVALAAAADADLPANATVVVVNPTAGGTGSDVLRSHLMGQGV